MPLSTTVLSALLVSIQLLLVSTVSASSPAAQLYLSLSSQSRSTFSPIITLTAPQANAVLAHHLGVAQYENLPVTVNTNSDSRWEQALKPQHWQSSEGLKMVVLMECGKEGCEDYVPDTFSTVQPFNLPNLPLQSWTAVITLHLHRLASSLGLATDSPAVIGLESFISDIKKMGGWVNWVGEELGSRIGWESIRDKAKTAVVPESDNYGIFGDLDLLDTVSTTSGVLLYPSILSLNSFSPFPKSANTLVLELEHLSNLVDSLGQSRSNDDGPQSRGEPSVIAVHIKGMKELSSVHSRSSEIYQRAASLLRSMLTGALASISETGGEESQPTFVLITLPPYSPPLLRKRSAWLQPFSSSNRYNRRREIPQAPSALKKRAIGASQKVGRVVAAAKRTAVPVVPTGKICFSSEDDLNNRTESCLGRGVAVKGVTTRGGDCWVCSCGRTTVDGKTTRWAGEGCEKEDLSGDFVLLFFSGLGLLLVLLVSVMLLYNVGSGELPGTLASVGGGAAGHVKKD